MTRGMKNDCTLTMLCEFIQVKTIADEVNTSFLGIGFDPKWKFEDVPLMPKARYGLMKAYMPTVGTLGHDMMFRSCTVQVNCQRCC